MSKIYLKFKLSKVKVKTLLKIVVLKLRASSSSLPTDALVLNSESSMANVLANLEGFSSSKSSWEEKSSSRKIVVIKSLQQFNIKPN